MALGVVLGVIAAAIGCVQTSTPTKVASAGEQASAPERSPARAVLASTPPSVLASERLADDGDGVVGEADECPELPEDFDGEDDEDGCPDLACRIDPCQITLLELVYFESDAWKLDERLHRMLGDVAWALRLMPEITVEIGGHTDSKGAADDNEELSQRRVDSVRDYLLAQGIAPERMTSRGYGEGIPVDTNKSAQGRANNRRVEIRRTDPGVSTVMLAGDQTWPSTVPRPVTMRCSARKLA